MNLRIEEPCHENWNAMTQQEKGRHCDKCCKTVFDFTKMPTEEVIQFIASRKKDSVCGRFTAEQVSVPAAAKIKPGISFRFKKFLAALVLVFGGALFTGCGNELQGKLISMDSSGEKTAQLQNPDTAIPKTIAKDTVPHKADTTEVHLKGRVKCVPKAKEERHYNGGVTIEEPTFVGLTVIEENINDSAR
jgi:hypothetical protein